MEIVQKRQPTDLTTTAVFRISSQKLISLIQQPIFLLELSPLIISHSDVSANTATLTLIDRIPILFGFSVDVSATVHFTCTETGHVADVEAGWGWLKTTTRSSWSVGEGGRVTEVFEVFTAPWMMGWYVWKTAGESHRNLFVRLGEKLKGEEEE